MLGAIHHWFCFTSTMERKHPSRQMTMQQSRTADEEQAWINQQKKKCIQTAENVKIRKELAEEEDRKRKLQDDTSVQPPQPTASTSSGSPRKKRKRKQPDPADLAWWWRQWWWTTRWWPARPRFRAWGRGGTMTMTKKMVETMTSCIC